RRALLLSFELPHPLARLEVLPLECVELPVSAKGLRPPPPRPPNPKASVFLKDAALTDPPAGAVDDQRRPQAVARLEHLIESLVLEREGHGHRPHEAFDLFMRDEDLALPRGDRDDLTRKRVTLFGQARG